MRCPRCNSSDDKVIDSRSVKNGTAIRRRRECIACSHRFTTYEEINRVDLHVIKRDGRHELLDRQKLFNGISKACEKRPISSELIHETVNELIEELETEYSREIPHKVIGEKVMRKLHDLDEVAYVRYVSVYRQFHDVTEFLHEIKSIEKRGKLDSKLQQELFNPSSLPFKP